MEAREILQLINTLVATLAVPPSLLLLLTVVREKGIISTEQRRINRALTILFFGISVSALINTALALSSIMGGGQLSHDVAPYRSLFINIFFSIVSWFIYFAHIGVHKQK